MAANHRLNLHIGGIYPLSHFDFESDPLILKTLFTQEMLKKGFLATNSSYSCYAHKQDNIDQYLKAVDEVFEYISQALTNGNPKTYLTGPVCQSGFKRLS